MQSSFLLSWKKKQSVCISSPKNKVLIKGLRSITDTQWYQISNKYTLSPLTCWRIDLNLTVERHISPPRQNKYELKQPKWPSHGITIMLTSVFSKKEKENVNKPSLQLPWNNYYVNKCIFKKEKENVNKPSLNTSGVK